MDVVEELIDGAGRSACASPSRVEPDAAFVNVESVEVRDGDFLVLAPWAPMILGDLSGWKRGSTSRQWADADAGTRSAWYAGGATTRPMRELAGGHTGTTASLIFPGERITDSDLDLTGSNTMVPDLIRDVDKMFVGSRGNAASRV